MTSSAIFALISTLVVSLTAFIGILLLLLKTNYIQKILNVLVAFSVGTLMGNAFFHLIPESYFHISSPHTVSWSIIVGFLIFFVLEQLIHTLSAHTVKEEQKATYGYLSLYADGIHNFMDGMLIGAAWMFSPELGWVTTITVLFHEIPQEISDFGILIKAGFTKRKALLFNFLAALTAILGTLLSIWLGNTTQAFSTHILPIIAGGFIYLSATSLLPELLKETNKKRIVIYLLSMLLGLGMMFYFSIMGGHQH